MEHQHVLVVFPHPDDEAFGVAGTIMSHTNAGVPVTYVCLTLGEMGRNMGRPIFANRESLPEIRKKELAKAASILGIEDLRMFGMRDKTVEFTDQDELINRISKVINETNPTLVITFYPGYAVHPDHNATGAAVIQAVQHIPKGQRPTVYTLAFSKGSEDVLGPPDVEINIEDFAERKLQVLEAHESQTASFIDDMKRRYKDKDEGVMRQLTKERFWTYSFDD